MGSLCSGGGWYPEASDLRRGGGEERIGAARTRARQEQQEAQRKPIFEVVEPDNNNVDLAIVKEQAIQALEFAEIWKQETERVVDAEALERIKAATRLRLAGQLPSVPRSTTEAEL
jgi:hypothetical protein